ncbi:MAG TPA: hypothetical protein DCS36_16525, partial [Sphingobacterium sp.]|nr:hypothetical protein [Sphingobacterium sp.]
QKINVIPGIDMSENPSMGEEIQSHLSDALSAQSFRTLRWLEVAKKVPKIKHRLFLNENINVESSYLEPLHKSQKKWESEILNCPLTEEPDTLKDKNGKTNNNRR